MINGYARFVMLSIISWICLLIAAGCQSATIEVGRDMSVDLDAIKRVAIIPFENHSKDRLAGDKVTAIFISAMVRITSVDIVDPGETLDALAAQGAETKKLSPLLIKRIGAKIGAEAMIFGSVEEFSMEKFHSTVLPVVSVSARMVDVNTGKVLWVATASDSGLSRVPIINIGETRTRTALAAKVVKKLISKVYSQ